MQKTEMSFFRDKRILITGHTGFKGSWLSRILIDAGAKVTGVSLAPPTSPSIFSICRLENQMDSVIGDVRDFELLKEVFERVQPQIVIHLAAKAGIKMSEDELKAEANKWELSHGGISGRTAQQFIYYLQGQEDEK